MGVFKVLTDYLPNFEDDSRGTWAVDPSDGYYTAKGRQFVKDVQRFMEERPAYELNQYQKILEDNGLEWERKSMMGVNVQV